MKREEKLTDLIRRIRTFILSGTHDDAAFNELALDAFHFQREHNLAYRQYCGDRTISRWQEIPPVITSAFKETDWTVLPPDERLTVFYSSGTSARERSRHFHSAETLALYEQSLLAWFKPFVLPEGASADFAILTPPPGQAPNSSLVHMFETVSRTLGTGQFFGFVNAEQAWELDFQKLKTLAERTEPIVLCGTAFSFVHLCDGLIENRISVHLPAGSRVFETGGYKGRSRVLSKDELHRMISKTVSIPQSAIICEYGMSELSSQAYDRKFGSHEPRLFRFPLWTRVQIVSPETGREAREGEPGLIRIWDLANVGSVIALQTEDLGVRKGDGFELPGRAALAEARGCSLMPAA